MWTLLTIVALSAVPGLGNLDVRVEDIPSAPGLYYEHQAEARLYNSDWKVMTYVDTQQASENLDIIEKYIKLTLGFCKRHDSTLWLNLTSCRTSINEVDRKLDRLKHTHDLVRQITRSDDKNHRQRRGILNFIGRVSHALFSVLDDENESFYNEKISQLETEQTDLIKLAKQQMIVVKSTLKSVNHTLQDVARNEAVLAKGLELISDYVNKENGEIKQKYTYTTLLVTLNEHAIQLERALMEVREEYDVIIQAVLNAQKGIIQPHILLPVRLIKILKASQNDFPRDLSVPIPLSDAYAYQLVNILDTEVYLIVSKLVYVVRVPLVSHYTFNIYRVIQFPIRVNEESNKYVLIQPEKDVPVIDTTKQYYVRQSRDELTHCKIIQETNWVCKQDFPLQISQSANECEVQLLQPIQTVPKTCSQRII
jgi:hypothetical protein